MTPFTFSAIPEKGNWCDHQPELLFANHIAQFTCAVEAGDTIETLAAKVQRLEHEHFAPAIERLL